MKVIGHRGAAGLALENTIEAIAAGIAAGVDGIEIDVRLTTDGHFVLCHDATIKRVSAYEHVIDKTTLKQLKALPLSNGQPIATLQDAVKAAGKVPIIVEVKGSGWAIALAKYFHKHPLEQVRVISFNHPELAEFHTLMPHIPVYANERTNAFEALQFARMHNFAGVDLNFWLVNPMTYWLAKRSKLEVIVYTVNLPWIVRFLYRLFPDITITTNYPQLMQFVRDHVYPKRKKHLHKT
jgi:glycerophosphoryl diester phosphodiesterase